MGKDAKKKEPAGKGKEKQSAGASDEGASKDKGGKGDKLGTCSFVKARHILSEKQGKINEVYQKLREGWLDNGDKVPPAEFGKINGLSSKTLKGFHYLFYSLYLMVLNATDNITIEFLSARTYGVYS